MKKILSLLIAIIILLPTQIFAIEIPGYEGGINNENNYKEVVFITGEPIEFEGTLKINIKEKKDQKTETYTYKLENKKLNGKLSRTIKLTATINTKENQTTSQKTLDSYKETITIGKEKYEVKTEDHEWNQGQVVEDTGLLQFYAGDWSARKTYKKDKGAEEITVQTIGNLVGYHSPWSATETQTLQYIINYENKMAEEENKWEGTATVEASYNKTKDYNYVENVPNQISFKGGYILTEKHENVLKYNYDLPYIKDGEIKSDRNIGKGSTEIDTNPIITRLNIPAVRDIRGLDSEKDILLIASMEGLPLQTENIGPSTAMSRGDFARAIVETMNIELPKEETKRSKRNKIEKLPIYIDTPLNHRNNKYIEAVSERNIMEGMGKGLFAPDRSITKAEAVTILVRTLGFKNLAPIQNYTTGFDDDSQIPSWGKDHIYMAKQIGLIEDSSYFYPNKALTKEEAAVLLVNYINYLQNDLFYEFRENIIN